MISLNSLPNTPYQVLARAIRRDKVEPKMIKEMFKLRQFANHTEEQLNMVDIHLILIYLEETYSIEDYPELWI